MNRPKQETPDPRRRMRVVMVALLGLVMIAVGSAAAWIHRSPVLTSIVMARLGLGKPPQETFGSNSINLLVLGCDEDQSPNWLRSASGIHVIKKQARSDMMMILRLDFNKKALTGVSIPRDMQCKLDGASHKINAYHAYGGPNLAKRAVETLVGVPIDRVVVLDFDAVQHMVDRVGGVDLTVDKDLNYDDNAGNIHVHIRKGFHHMDGIQAMGFVRIRHNDDDFHRQARQKQFMLAFKDAAFKRPQDLPEVTEQAAKVIGVGLTNDEVGALAGFMQTVPSKSIRLGVVPPIDPSANPMLLDRKTLVKVLADYGFNREIEKRSQPQRVAFETP